MDQGSRCDIVTKVTEWPATIDRRYHDAVIFELDGVTAEYFWAIDHAGERMEATSDHCRKTGAERPCRPAGKDQ
jgi:hypothetical protein